MAIDRAFVDRHLREIEGNVRLLKELGQRPAEVFRADLIAFHAAQHLLQVSIEGMLAVCLHFAAEVPLPAPESHAKLLEELGARGVLRRPDMIPRYQAMARFRKLVVHRYWEVDPARVHEILRDHLGNFQSFAMEVTEYLDTLPPCTPDETREA